MPACDHCGEQCELPFHCSYCGGSYCADHRLPPSHRCINEEGWRMRTSRPGPGSEPATPLPPAECFYCGVRTAKIFYCPACGHEFCSFHKRHEDHHTAKNERPYQQPVHPYPPAPHETPAHAPPKKPLDLRIIAAFLLIFIIVISAVLAGGIFRDSTGRQTADMTPAPVQRTVTTALPAVTIPPVTVPTEMAYLENVDCNMDQTTETAYHCTGKIRIKRGAYAEVQVTARYPDNNTFDSGIVPMGGSNYTLQSFIIFPNLKYRDQDATYSVRLDTTRYPVIMDGRNGIAYLNPPPAPPVTAAAGIRPSTSGTPAGLTDTKNKAFSRTFRYVLHGEPGTIDVVLDPRVYSAQKSLPSLYTCTRPSHDPSPCTQDEACRYYLKFLDEPGQKSGLTGLVRQIRSETADRDDQARIAISLVQEIPYDHDRVNAPIRTGTARYPYQVLYEHTGVCSDKSLLLAYLLRELGYGVVLFSFEPEKHMAVGIKSSAPYDYLDSGYAFVETTIPSIPTDAGGSYAGAGELSSTPDLCRISDGIPFAGIAEEYRDAVAFSGFRGSGTLPPEKYREWEILLWKYGMTTEDGKTVTENPSGKPLCGDGIYCNGQCWKKCLGVPQCTSRGLVCYY